MIFKNRSEAAGLLSTMLEKYKSERGVVISIPKGGVQLGTQLARFLHMPFDLVLTKKIGHPLNPEYAIGAVCMDGTLLLDDRNDVPEEHIKKEKKRLIALMKRKYAYYKNEHAPLSLKNKIVIVTDDGIATGKTMLLAIESIRKKNPKKIVVAVPVAPERIKLILKDKTDEFICLRSSKSFFGISQFYENLEPISDEKIIELIRNMKKRQSEANEPHISMA